jgi:hypothetical protein
MQAAWFSGPKKSHGPSLVTMALAVDLYVEGRPEEGKKEEK